MAIYDFFLSRNGPVSSLQNYVGHTGRLFYDSSNGVIRLSDGVTPGGVPIPITVATTTITGGVKLGPGVTTNGQGQIVIDSTGLDFSFGDFAASIGTYTSNTEYAILSAINDDEDVVIASNGAGGINVVGQFHVHPTNGSLTEILEEEPVFAVKADGQVKILVPIVDSTAGAVSIVGSSLGQFISPVNTGVMLHVTGNLASPGIPSRIYNDAQNAFAAFVARRFNGTVASPTAVLANEEIMRISGTAHNGTIIPGTGNQRIVYKALGNQTLSNQGGDMEFWTTPLNSTTIGKVATVGSTGITLETGKVLTGDVTGNADTVTNGVYTSGSYSDPSWLTISKNKVGLSAVENTALSTWAGSSNITTVGTLGSLTVTNLVSAKNFNGQARNAGTLGAAGTLTIDFATDHNVLVTLTTTATIAFSNITAGKTVTVLVKNATGNNRAVTLGVVAGNTSGGNAAPNVNDGRTGVIVYRTFGTATTDVYCEFN